MIRSALASAKVDLFAFADGLTEWIRGESTIEAEAAAALFAEVLLLHRQFVIAHFEKK